MDNFAKSRFSRKPCFCSILSVFALLVIESNWNQEITQSTKRDLFQIKGLDCWQWYTFLMAPMSFFNAGLRFVFLHVTSQIGLHHRFVVTNGTRVVFLARVSLDVSIQVGFRCWPVITSGAGEDFLSLVRFHVQNQMGFRHRSVVTQRTGIAFLARVDFHVPSQIRLPDGPVVAMVAWILPLAQKPT